MTRWKARSRPDPEALARSYTINIPYGGYLYLDFRGEQLYYCPELPHQQGWFIADLPFMVPENDE